MSRRNGEGGKKEVRIIGNEVEKMRRDEGQEAERRGMGERGRMGW